MRMCVLIGLQVCSHRAMKHENGVSNMVGCLRVVRNYSTRALRISSFYFLRLKMIIL